MTRIIGLSGSLRRQSYNTGLLNAALEFMPAGITLQIESIAQIPLYDGDLEAQGIPQVVARLKDEIARCDGLLISTPEYNNSIPGVLKNAIDWLSRPSADIPRVFGRRPIAIMGTTPGPFGTTLAQNAWLSVVRTLRMRPWLDGRLMLSHADTLFDAQGTLTDERARKKLQEFVGAYAEYLQSLR
jgi:chromate reductase, NAD(P)H dehydrogenase (quinone)